MSSATTISAGDFNATTGTVTNVRVVVRRTGTAGTAHSPSPMNDRNGVTRALTFCQSSLLDVQMTSGLNDNTPNFRILKRGTAWLANGDCNGGTVTVAEAPGASYTDPVEVGVLAMSSATLPTSGGSVNLTLFAPSRNAGTPFLGLAVFGNLATSGLALGGIVTGNLSLNPALLVFLPSQNFDNVSGTMAYNFTMPGFASGSKVFGQPVAYDPTANRIYLGNTAQIAWQ